MLGYLVNVRLGAAIYNLVHTLTLPLALLLVGYLLHSHSPWPSHSSGQPTSLSTDSWASASNIRPSSKTPISITFPRIATQPS